MGIFSANFGPLTYFWPTAKRPISASPDVIFVNGYYTTPNSAHRFVEWMGGQGVACSVPNLGSLLGQWQTARVKTSASYLNAHLKSLKKTRKPWLVGHSLGGVISRYAVHEYHLQDYVSGVITLGTPHRGVGAIGLTFLCGLGFLGPAALDLLPGSKVMKTFADSKWPFALPLISIASTGDRLCPVDASAVEDGPSSHCTFIKIDGLGHNELVRDGRSLNILLDCISRFGRP